MAAPSHALAPVSARNFRPPRFGLGGSRLGESPGPDGDAQAIATIDAAYQAGIRFFDTSPAYGVSEERLGTALQRRPRSEFLLSTKVAGADARDSVRSSMDRLGLAVDLVFIRDQDEAAYSVLNDLRRDGVIKAIGVACNDWRVLDRIVRDVELDAVLLAGQYSLLDQSATPLLDRCLARGVSVIVSGILTPQVLQTEQSSDPATIRARRISAVCERYGVSLPQAALAFPSRHSAVTSVLIAAASPAEIRADAALVRQPVPSTLWRDPELLKLVT
ncbi:D-threo-aldose 1-dehydrogenase [Kribbella steppae]|uniref:D-threo-aldose 1-dehydrogenase n=1 Tax=Kribbella steppae TaxID=2512223 RepID=A0A4R2HVQ2_9ACTN|nr:aldo/keto reductase [Kribbella steppae]TCO35524.1 D-threo-aldose 1-dehydrogenase [Kribbella steppae]